MHINKHYTLYLTSLLLTCVMTSCNQETLEDRAAKDAADYTRKYCPTPVINCWRTDSITFKKDTRVYTYYCSFCDEMDDQKIIDDNKDKIYNMLISSIKESTVMKPYIQAGFRFRYVCRSAKNPDTILLQAETK